MSDNLVVSVNGKEIDVSGAWPLKWKDIKAFQRMGIADTGEVDATNPEVVEKFLIYILQKLDPSITEEDVGEITVIDVRRIMSLFGEEVEKLDRPS